MHFDASDEWGMGKGMRGRKSGLWGGDEIC